MKIFFHGKGTRISTGHFVLGSDWDKKKKKVKGNTDEAHGINESLNSLRAQVRKSKCVLGFFYCNKSHFIVIIGFELIILRLWIIIITS